MNLREFICNSLDNVDCIPFDMQNMLKKTQCEVESMYICRDKRDKKDKDELELKQKILRW